MGSIFRRVHDIADVLNAIVLVAYNLALPFTHSFLLPKAGSVVQLQHGRSLLSDICSSIDQFLNFSI